MGSSDLARLIKQSRSTIDLFKKKTISKTVAKERLQLNAVSIVKEFEGLTRATAPRFKRIAMEFTALMREFSREVDRDVNTKSEKA